MNIHAKIEDLYNSLGLKNISNNKFEGIFIVNEEIVDDCGVYDYERKFLFVTIHKNSDDLSIYIGSVDDSETLFVSPKVESDLLEYMHSELLKIFDDKVELPWEEMKNFIDAFDLKEHF